MPTLLVGYETSFIGEAVVGGPAAFNSTGTLAFTGAASNKKVANKTPSGVILFEGSASHIQGRLFAASGEFNHSGAAGKSISVESVGILELEGTAVVDYVGVSHVAKTASGSIDFSGSSNFIRRTSWNTAAGEITFEEVSARAVSTHLATSGSINFTGVATADLTTPYVAVGNITFTSYGAFIRARNVLTAGTMKLSGTGAISKQQLGASAWNPEGNGALQSLVTEASVWQQSATPSGAVVGSNNIWKG